MDNCMYQEQYELQDKHWWFVSKKKIVLFFVSNIFKTDIRNNILDVGCGTGLMLNDLSEFGDVYGLDYSDEAIKYSNSIFEGMIKKGKLPDDVPYEKNFFDIIIALDILEHIDNDISALEVLADLNKKNGQCIITVPAFMFLWSFHDEINYHKRRYTVKDLKYKIEKSGFEIEMISYYNFFLFLPILFVRIVSKFFKKNNKSDVNIPSKPINFILKKIFTFEKHLLRYINFPFGVSIIAVLRKK